MNVFAKFECLEFLTKNEKSLIEYIKSKPVQFVKMSIEEICEVLNVSKSTVIRFCKKMGYDGLYQFKLMIVASFSDSLAHSDFNIDFNFPFKKHSESLEIASAIRKIYEQSVYNASIFLDLKALENAIKVIDKANKIVICTDSVGYSFANIFKDKLEKIGKLIVIPQSNFMKISAISGCEYDDVMIYIDISNDEKFFKEITKMCRLNKVKIILISIDKQRVINNSFASSIFLSKNETVHYNVGDFSIIVSLMYLLDVFYALIFQINYDKNNEILQSNYLKYKNL